MLALLFYGKILLASPELIEYTYQRTPRGLLTSGEAVNHRGVLFEVAMTVYYLRAKNGAIKIGYTQSLNDRLSALSTSSPLELELVAQEEGGMSLERERHEEYKDHRVRGEWFYPCDSLNRRIASLSPGYKPLSYVDADLTPLERAVMAGRRAG